MHFVSFQTIIKFSTALTNLQSKHRNVILFSFCLFAQAVMLVSFYGLNLNHIIRANFHTTALGRLKNGTSREGLVHSCLQASLSNLPMPLGKCGHLCANNLTVLRY